MYVLICLAVFSLHTCVVIFLLPRGTGYDFFWWLVEMALLVLNCYIAYRLCKAWSIYKKARKEQKAQPQDPAPELPPQKGTEQTPEPVIVEQAAVAASVPPSPQDGLKQTPVDAPIPTRPDGTVNPGLLYLLSKGARIVPRDDLPADQEPQPAPKPEPQLRSEPKPSHPQKKEADPVSLRGGREAANAQLRSDVGNAQLYYICPHCGRPSPTDEHACKCGYRLSDMLPAYRLCPDCNRFVPQSQALCECGHSFPAEEQLLHVCPACGLVLPLSQQKCDCGYQFQPSQATTLQQSQPAASRPAPVPSPDKDTPISWSLAQKVFSAVVIFCAVLGTLIYLAWRNNHYPSAFSPPTPAASTSQAATPAPTPVPTSALTKQGRPANGYILRGSALDRLAPLTIQTDEGSDYFISLCEPGASRATMTFFVRGGQTADVTVPLGVYEIYYASGWTWYGTIDLFGPDTLYTKCDGTFEFAEDEDGYSGWTLTLYRVTNGNMTTDFVTKEDYPE